MIKTNKNWIPDLQVLIWNWKHFWVEVKQKTWTASKLQEFRIKKLIDHGDIAFVCYGWDDFLNKYNTIKWENNSFFNN